jgi:hypothetical protein
MNLALRQEEVCSCAFLSLTMVSLHNLYDFPTSSEGRLPNIVDAQKKRQYTPFKIETVTDFKRRSLPWKQSTTPLEPILDDC